MIALKLTCPQLPSRPHTQGRSNHSSEQQLKRNLLFSFFYCGSSRAAAVSKVVIFQRVSGWLPAVVCHTAAPGADAPITAVMGRVFGPRKGRKTYSRGAKRSCGRTFLNSSSSAYSWVKNILWCHANSAVTTSCFRHTYRCLHFICDRATVVVVYSKISGSQVWFANLNSKSLGFFS